MNPSVKPPLNPTLGEFGQRLRALREAQGWSQEHLADLAGVHFSYLSRLERGQANPTLLNIARLHAALGGTSGGVLLDGLPVPD